MSDLSKADVVAALRRAVDSIDDRGYIDSRILSALADALELVQDGRIERGARLDDYIALRAESRTALAAIEALQRAADPRQPLGWPEVTRLRALAEALKDGCPCQLLNEVGQLVPGFHFPAPKEEA